MMYDILFWLNWAGVGGLVLEDKAKMNDDFGRGRLGIWGEGKRTLGTLEIFSFILLSVDFIFPSFLSGFIFLWFFLSVRSVTSIQKPCAISFFFLFLSPLPETLVPQAEISLNGEKGLLGQTLLIFLFSFIGRPDLIQPRLLSLALNSCCGYVGDTRNHQNIMID